MLHRLLASYPALILFLLQIAAWYARAEWGRTAFWSIWLCGMLTLLITLCLRTPRILGYDCAHRLTTGICIGLFLLALSGLSWGHRGCFRPQDLPDTHSPAISGILTRLQLVEQEEGRGLRFELEVGSERNWVIVSPRTYQNDPRLSNLHLGQSLQLQVTHLPAEPARLPGGFSSIQYLRSLGCSSQFFLEHLLYVGEGESHRLNHRLFQWFWKLQNQATEGLCSVFSKQEVGILAAMGWGDRRYLDTETQSAFRLNGLAHMLVVSGAHLALVATGSAKLCSRLPIGRRKRMVLQALLLTGFACLCQWEPSITRAWIMSSLRIIAQMTKRPLPGLQSLALAGFLYLLIQPWRIFHFGFLLSLSATLALQILQQPLFHAEADPLISEPVSKRFNERLKQQLALKIRALLYCQVVLFPFLCSMGCQQSLWSPLFQLLLTPILSWLTGCTLLARLAQCLLGERVWLLCKPALRLCIASIIRALQPSGNRSWSWILHPGLIPSGLVFVLFLIILRSRPHRISLPRWRKRLLVTFPLAILCCFTWQRFWTPDLQIDFLDVGQGDAILLRTPAHSLLIDAGKPEWGPKLEKALHALGIRQVDAWVLTHAHSDHFGGARTLIDAGMIRSIVWSNTVDQAPAENQAKEFPAFRSQVQKHGIPERHWKRGDQITLGSGIIIEVLHPDSNWNHIDENQNSLILQVHTRAGSILLTGDAEEPVEEQIHSDLPAHGFLKVGHHGSSHATMPAFVEKMKPLAAVISVGKKNRYGHPADRVLQLLQSVGCTVFRTDEDGTVSLCVRGTNLTMDSYLGKKRWRANKILAAQHIRRPYAPSNQEPYSPCICLQGRSGISRTTGFGRSNRSVWIPQRVTWTSKFILRQGSRSPPRSPHSNFRVGLLPFFQNAESSSLSQQDGSGLEDPKTQSCSTGSNRSKVARMSVYSFERNR